MGLPGKITAQGSAVRSTDAARAEAARSRMAVFHSAASRLVDEALRLSEYPGIVLRPGPTRRRAALASGPDVREVARAVGSARARNLSWPATGCPA
jgi:hypothetical protein